MTEIVLKILVELLCTLALATKQIKEGKLSESIFGGEVLWCLTEYNVDLFVKLLGEKDVEAVLHRVDRLTQEEARITAAQTLGVVYGLIQNMRVVMNGEKNTRGLSTRCVLRVLLSRRQGIYRPCYGRAQYVFPATINRKPSDRALEIMQELASDLNKSKRQSFFNVATADRNHRDCLAGDSLQLDIFKWLLPPDPWTNHHVARKSRHPESAAWFIQGDMFSEWKASEEPSSCLWIYGKRP